jgi:hypothetical protein
MPDVIRILDNLTSAQAAREALLADGFDDSQVQLRIPDDEAGPVKGNFLVGNSSDRDPGHTYDRNYANIEQAGECILTINALSPAMALRAAEILGRFGAREHPAM